MPAWIRVIYRCWPDGVPTIPPGTAPSAVPTLAEHSTKQIAA